MKKILFLIFPIFTSLGQMKKSTLILAERKEFLGKLDSAIIILSDGLENNRSNESKYPLLLKRGYIMMSMNNIKNAESDFQQAIHLFPDSNQAYAALGYLNLRTKRFFKSIDNFEKAIKRQNKDLSVLFCLGHALWDVKNYDASVIQIDKVISIDPHHPDANYLKGRIFARTGKFKEAIPYYNLALLLEPNSKIAEVYGYRGVAYLGFKEYVLAEQDLLKSIEKGMDRDEINFALMEIDRYNQHKK